MSCDLTLYLVTDTAMCSDVRVAETAAAAVRGGATMVQVRDPHASDQEFATLTSGVVEALRGTGVPVIVNDAVHLVADCGADGAHIGQGDMDPLAARELLGPGKLLGLSVQTEAHIDQALALPPGTVDYLGLGPIWAQTTKLDASAPVGVDAATELVERARRGGLPTVLIGGIGLNQMAQARSTGADGVAVVSAICGQPDPQASAQALLQAWQGAR